MTIEAPLRILPLVWHVDGSLPYQFNPNDTSGPRHRIGRSRYIVRQTEGWMTLLSIGLSRQWSARTERERLAFEFHPLTLTVAVTFPRGKRRWDDDNAIAALKHPRDLIGQLLGRKGDRGITTAPVQQHLWSSLDAGLRLQYPHGFTTFTVSIREE